MKKNIIFFTQVLLFMVIFISVIVIGIGLLSGETFRNSLNALKVFGLGTLLLSIPVFSIMGIAKFMDTAMLHKNGTQYEVFKYFITVALGISIVACCYFILDGTKTLYRHQHYWYLGLFIASAVITLYYLYLEFVKNK